MNFFVVQVLFLLASLLRADEVLRDHFEESAPVITMKDHDFFLATRLGESGSNSLISRKPT
jgi:hypothetical protein